MIQRLQFAVSLIDVTQPATNNHDQYLLLRKNSHQAVVGFLTYLNVCIEKIAFEAARYFTRAPEDRVVKIARYHLAIQYIRWRSVVRKNRYSIIIHS